MLGHIHRATEQTVRLLSRNLLCNRLQSIRTRKQPHANGISRGPAIARLSRSISTPSTPLKSPVHPSPSPSPSPDDLPTTASPAAGSGIPARLFLSSCVQLENPWPAPNKFNSLEACAKRLAAKNLPPDHILWRDSFDSARDGTITYDVNPDSGRRAAWIEYPPSSSSAAEPGVPYASYYSGDVNSRGQRHGWGVQMHMDGVQFYTTGKWHEDKMIQRRPVPLDHLIWKVSQFHLRSFKQHPRGLMFQDEGIYEGEINREEMLPHGFGTLRLLMGDPAAFWIQEGHFHLGVLHGTDCLVQCEDTDEMYRGGMKLGVRDGWGKYRNGANQYEGEWRNGQQKLSS